MSARATGSPDTTPRRGRRPAGEDTKGLIEEAARAQFALQGYDAASLRGIARAAGVDSALVHHYFEGKADLFAQAVVLSRVDPRQVLGPVLSGPLDGLGERIVRTFLTVWDEPDNQERLMAMLRAVMGSQEVATLMRDLVLGEVLGRVADRLPDQPALRSGAVLSQLFGMALARYLLQVPAVATASPDQLVAVYGPTVQRYLTGQL